MNRRIAVFISGRGSNLKSLFYASKNSVFPVSIELVISDNKSSLGLAFADENKIKYELVDFNTFQNKNRFEDRIKNLISSKRIDLICLAGFMRILSAEFIEFFSGDILNIHPSLLPKYKGLNTHQRAINAKDKYAGCSVHYVTKEVDNGEIIIQKSLLIKANDTAASLSARVLELEHEIYPEALKKILS